MTPAELHFELTKLQLQRRVGEGRPPTMWTSLAPKDGSGKSFRCFIRFEYGPSTSLDFDLDAAIPLDAESIERLEDAIIEPCGWH